MAQSIWLWAGFSFFFFGFWFFFFNYVVSKILVNFSTKLEKLVILKSNFTCLPCKQWTPKM
jgi:hypothetical protein